MYNRIFHIHLLYKNNQSFISNRSFRLSKFHEIPGNRFGSSSSILENLASATRTRPKALRIYMILNIKIFSLKDKIFIISYIGCRTVN